MRNRGEFKNGNLAQTDSRPTNLRDEIMKFLLLLSLLYRIQTAKSWCACKSVSQVDITNLCARRYLFVISTGRSGSTTILQALNLIRGVRLIGETNILHDLRLIYEDFLRLSTKYSDTNYLIDLQELYQELNQPLEPQISEVDFIFGSKEVHLEINDISFVQKLFPCSRFIFSVRQNFTAQVGSAFLKKDKVSVEQIQKRTQALYALYRAMGPQMAHLIETENFSRESFNVLLRWLGFSKCSFGQVGHHNSNGTYFRTYKSQLQGQCHYRESIL
jgi:hypothetical protein